MSFHNNSRSTIVFSKSNALNDDLIAAFISSDTNTCFRSNNAKFTYKVIAETIPIRKLKRFVNFYMH